jgi:Ca2+-binding RTX toxin-like protein
MSASVYERRSMKRATLFAVVVALLVALGASVAVAQTLVGDDGPDEITGTQGNDVIRGYGGNDVLIGGLGNDTIHGGDGADELYGRLGNDFLNGGAGGDLIRMDDGRDEAYGVSGNDSILSYRDDQADFIYCGTGNEDFASVQSGDYVDNTPAANLVGTTILSCEKVSVNGLVVIDRTGS